MSLVKGPYSLKYEKRQGQKGEYYMAHLVKTWQDRNTKEFKSFDFSFMAKDIPVVLELFQDAVNERNQKQTAQTPVASKNVGKIQFDDSWDTDPNQVPF